jgi:hypothetical protein
MYPRAVNCARSPHTIAVLVFVGEEEGNNCFRPTFSVSPFVPAPPYFHSVPQSWGGCVSTFSGLAFTSCNSTVGNDAIDRIVLLSSAGSAVVSIDLFVAIWVFFSWGLVDDPS